MKKSSSATSLVSLEFQPSLLCQHKSTILFPQMHLSDSHQVVPCKCTLNLLMRSQGLEKLPMNEFFDSEFHSFSLLKDQANLHHITSLFSFLKKSFSPYNETANQLEITLFQYFTSYICVYLWCVLTNVSSGHVLSHKRHFLGKLSAWTLNKHRFKKELQNFTSLQITACSLLAY